MPATESHHLHQPAPPVLTARFDRPGWPDLDHGTPPLGLDVCFTPPVRPDLAAGPARRPLAVALVIDQSASMGREVLRAVRDAVIQLQYRLDPQDQLAIVAFDSEASVLAPLAPLARTQAATSRATTPLAALTEAIRSFEPRGLSSLSEGWRAGIAALPAGDATGTHDARTIILSDGYATDGITDPDALRRLAAEAAASGRRTSCIAFGDHYVMDQLFALAAGGGGGLHHARRPEEIADRILGELGLCRDIAARDVEIELLVPNWVDLTIAGGSEAPSQSWNNASNKRRHLVRMPDAAGGRPHHLGIMMQPAEGEEDISPPSQDWIFMTARWRCTVTGELHTARLGGPNATPQGSIPMPVDLAPPDAVRDEDAAETVLWMWYSRLRHEVAEFSVRFAYEEASNCLADVLPGFTAFARGLRDEHDLADAVRMLERDSRRRWERLVRRNRLVSVRLRVMLELGMVPAPGYQGVFFSNR